MSPATPMAPSPPAYSARARTLEERSNIGARALWGGVCRLQWTIHVGTVREDRGRAMHPAIGDHAVQRRRAPSVLGVHGGSTRDQLRRRELRIRGQRGDMQRRRAAQTHVVYLRERRHFAATRARSSLSARLRAHARVCRRPPVWRWPRRRRAARRDASCRRRTRARTETTPRAARHSSTPSSLEKSTQAVSIEFCGYAGDFGSLLNHMELDEPDASLAKPAGRTVPWVEKYASARAPRAHSARAPRVPSARALRACPPRALRARCPRRVSHARSPPPRALLITQVPPAPRRRRVVAGGDRARAHGGH